MGGGGIDCAMDNGIVWDDIIIQKKKKINGCFKGIEKATLIVIVLLVQTTE